MKYFMLEGFEIFHKMSLTLKVVMIYGEENKIRSFPPQYFWRNLAVPVANQFASSF